MLLEHNESLSIDLNHVHTKPLKWHVKELMNLNSPLEYLNDFLVNLLMIVLTSVRY